MYIYGGVSGSYETDLWEFDPNISNWTQIDQVNSPGHLHGHCGCIINNRMFIFGGENIANIKQNNLYEFNFETNTWTSIGSLSPIPARSYHSCVSFENCIYIIGGEGLSSNVLGDFWKYCIDPPSITQIDMPLTYKRTKSVATVISDRIFVFGGYSGEFPNDFLSKLFHGNNTNESI